MGDQFYNSSIVEQLGIGIYVSLVWIGNNHEEHRNDNFHFEFSKAVAAMFENNKYQQAMFELRGYILSNYNNGFKAKDVFLQTIKSVVGV
uniref:Uncharacterized protein n=1 Tax=Meloidogyne enterolobii TaxID=390850 RepID=A0A6V7UCR5_MELEN|nr:unnamed protein product [Meloidogyne enterolobii]